MFISVLGSLYYCIAMCFTMMLPRYSDHAQLHHPEFSGPSLHLERCRNSHSLGFANPEPAKIGHIFPVAFPQVVDFPLEERYHLQ